MMEKTAEGAERTVPFHEVFLYLQVHIRIILIIFIFLNLLITLFLHVITIFVKCLVTLAQSVMLCSETTVR